VTKVFPGAWDCFDNLMYREQTIIPQVVFEEIERGQDDLLDWVKFYRRDSVVTPDLDRLKASKAIVQAYPRLLETKKNRSRSGARRLILSA